MHQPLVIHLYPMSNVAHLHQLFIGFEHLSRLAAYRIIWHFDGRRRYGHRPGGEYDAAAFAVMAEIEGGPTLCFDPHDGPSVIAPLYERCDVYFKRSYSRADHSGLGKAQPLGLNLHVDQAGMNVPGALRSLRLDTGLRRLREMARSLHLPGNFVATEAHMHAVPVPSDDPRILFMARAWDPGESRTPDPAKTQHRLQISAFRADCIRLLRKEFGPRFEGGFARTAFAQKQFPDALLEKSARSDKKRYLALLPGFDICVASEGLHRSTGWKFAEYLAFGRAIVCETMAYEATGPLEAGTNYLPYDTPEHCVEAAARLMNDKPRRAAMMARNSLYYRAYVSPFGIVLHALTRALAPERDPPQAAPTIPQALATVAP